jgi:nucleotide-binding universal stress UspA family protein
MYKHILLPTDGSVLAERAAAAGIALAAAVGARVTALHVLPRETGVALDSWAHPAGGYAEKLDQTLVRRGNEYLENIREAARYAGVECRCSLERAASVHEAIASMARAQECDLIVMGSKAQGDAAAILGSETVQALAMVNVAVLVQPPRDRPAAP